MAYKLRGHHLDKRLEEGSQDLLEDIPEEGSHLGEGSQRLGEDSHLEEGNLVGEGSQRLGEGSLEEGSLHQVAVGGSQIAAPATRAAYLRGHQGSR